MSEIDDGGYVYPARDGLRFADAMIAEGSKGENHA